MPESWDTCHGKLLTGSGTSSIERSVLQSTNLKGVGDLKTIVTLVRHGDIESGDCTAGFCRALIQYFLIILLFLHFGKVIYILCHYMLEVCDLLFGFDFTDYS